MKGNEMKDESKNTECYVIMKDFYPKMGPGGYLETLQINNNIKSWLKDNPLYLLLDVVPKYYRGGDKRCETMTRVYVKVCKSNDPKPTPDCFQCKNYPKFFHHWCGNCFKVFN